MKTLVMLELMPGDEYVATLTCFALERLRSGCPEEQCAVAACAPGTVAERFLNMALEVDRRAKETIEHPAATKEGYVKCAYVALRSLHFINAPYEPYELGLLIVVFRTRERILRRFVVPDLDVETPDYVRDMLGKELGVARASLPAAKATRAEEIITEKLADSVIKAFTDLAEFLTSSLRQ